MTRMSISFTDPNDNWVSEKIESNEYASKSELVNELIRKERQREAEFAYLNKRLEKAEQSGFSDASVDDIFARIKTKHGDKL